MLKKGTFGDSLTHFVRSVDIVDFETKDNILRLIEAYLSDELGIKFFTLYTESMVNDKPGLRTTDWIRGGERNSFSIQYEDDTYQGQVALAYEQSKSLWIVNAEKEKLEFADSYVDLWSKIPSDDIPKYVRRTENPIITSIIRPIRDDYRCFGAINFESVRYLEYSESVKEELIIISNAINTLYSLNNAYLRQKDNTKKEINYLSELKNSRVFTKLSKPRIFLASSSRAEDDVMGIINDVLDEYSEIIDLISWKDISESGLITQQILNEITSCQFGICYFSERDLNSDKKYIDNSNVLIEAGMLSGSSRDSSFENWIPIREEESPKMAFDLSPTRILYVPRSNAGKLNVEKFRKELNLRVKKSI